MMIKYVLVPMAMAVSTLSDAACVPDSLELGDIGPSSSTVCESLELEYPDSDLAVLDRDIFSGEKVSISVSVNGNSRSLNYRLVGADWVLESPNIASTRK